jgi:glycogen synthase
MKILIVTEDVPVQKLGGAGKHAVVLGNALIEAGHEVELLGGLRQDEHLTNNEFHGKLHTLIDMRNIGLKEVTFGIFNPIRQIYIARRIWTAIKQLDYKSFDVIHYHGHIAELGVLVHKNINYVHTLHDQGSECMTKLRFRNGLPCTAVSTIVCAECATKNKPNFIQIIISATAVKLHRLMAKKAFTKHKAIFVSDFLQNQFRNNVKNSSGINSVAIHNFTNVTEVQKLLLKNPIIKKKNEQPIILLVGRLDQTKGQQAFLEAVPDSLLNNVEIRIAGDGPDFAKLKQKYEIRGIKFLGFLSQEDVYKETIKADVCVVPSIWEEPCGTVSLEALALGKIVYALRRGGTPEQMKYCVFPNQLHLFEDIQSLSNALYEMSFPEKVCKVNLKSDVRSRLPEILNIYMQNSPLRQNE